MIVLHAPAHRLHHPTVEYYNGRAEPHAEQPGRIDNILDACRRLDLQIRIVEQPLSRRQLLTLHGRHYLRFLQQTCRGIPVDEQLMPSVFVHDTYTPLTAGTLHAARLSAGLAVAAAELVVAGEQRVVYALCRPPGHHAEADAMMGYCYFNNAALAAQQLASDGRRVAILDLDYHHGNGTQHLFYERSDVLYVSIHADPTDAFPYGSGYRDERGAGEGLGYTRNFPLTRPGNVEAYLRTLRRAIRTVQNFRPDYLVLSLGFDTYQGDPIGNLGLDVADYAAVGYAVANNLAYPTVIVQEGGYNVMALGALAESFLSGYQERNTTT